MALSLPFWPGGPPTSPAHGLKRTVTLSAIRCVRQWCRDSHGVVSPTGEPARDVELRFAGGRFDAEVVSVKALRVALSELSVFERAITAIAKDLFHTDNPSDQPLPDHFAESLSLDVDVEALARGSLKVPIRPSLLTRRGTPMFEVPYPYFERSVSLYCRVISELVEDGQSPAMQELSSQTRSVLSRSGQALNNDEQVHVASPSGRQCSVLPRIRELAASDGSERRISTVVAGRIIRIAADNHQFHLALCSEAGQPAIALSYDVARVPLDVLRNALTSDPGDGPIVAAEGEFAFDGPKFDKSASSIQRLIAAGEEGTRRMTTLLTELDDIESLEAGWLEESTPAPDREAIRGARRLSALFACDDLPFPHAFPMHDGGVALEWTLGSVEASITFESSAASATVASLDTIADEHRYEEAVTITPDFVRAWLSQFTTAA